MSSSISSSEPARAWRRFALLLVLWTAGLIVGIVGLAYAIDPYDTGRSQLFEGREIRASLEKYPGDGSNPPLARYPAADALQAAFASFPAGLDVVLIFPPQYIAFQPRPGTPRGVADAACKAAFRRLASTRRNTHVLDWRTDKPPNRVAANYFDQTHYRRPVAEAVESDLAAALVTGP
jgi:hypothetical protein